MAWWGHFPAVAARTHLGIGLSAMVNIGVSAKMWCIIVPSLMNAKKKKTFKLFKAVNGMEWNR